MKRKPCFRELLLAGLLISAIGVVFAPRLIRSGVLGKEFSVTLKHEPAGAVLPFPTKEASPTLPASVANRENTFQLFDRSPTDKDALISKTCSEKKADVSTQGDLWFRAASGHERFIAHEVIAAKFSPNGSKYAYCTQAGELFIETLTGERLAHIPRAIDPNWHSDSVVAFSAVPSFDYPELLQPAVYDLGSGEVTQLGGTEEK